LECWRTRASAALRAELRRDGSHIKSSPVFVGLGIGLEVLTVAALFTLFKNRG